MAAIGSAVATRSWMGGLTDPVSAVSTAGSKPTAGYGSVQTRRSAGPAAPGPSQDHIRWEAHERAHGWPAMVARGGPLPGLRPLLAGQRRGRVRRSAGCDRRARLPGVAGSGRHLAVTDDAIPRSRLGLRRLRLPGCPPAARHAG